MTCLDLITAIEDRIQRGWWSETSRDEEFDQVLSCLMQEIATPAGEAGLRWLCTTPMALHLFLHGTDVAYQPLVDALVAQAQQKPHRSALIQLLLSSASWLSEDSIPGIVTAILPTLTARDCGILAVAVRARRERRALFLDACRAKLQAADGAEVHALHDDLRSAQGGSVDAFWRHMAQLTSDCPHANRLFRLQCDLSNDEIEAGAWEVTLDLAEPDRAGFTRLCDFLSVLTWSRGNSSLVNISDRIPDWHRLFRGDPQPVIDLMGDPALACIVGDLAWTLAAIALSTLEEGGRIRRVLWEAVSQETVAGRPVVDLSAFLAAFLVVAGLERHRALEIARKSLAASPAERFLRLLSKSQETAATVIPILNDHERQGILEVVMGTYGMGNPQGCVAIGRLTATRLAG